MCCLFSEYCFIIVSCSNLVHSKASHTSAWLLSIGIWLFYFSYIVSVPHITFFPFVLVCIHGGDIPHMFGDSCLGLTFVCLCLECTNPGPQYRIIFLDSLVGSVYSIGLRLPFGLVRFSREESSSFLPGGYEPSLRTITRVHLEKRSEISTSSM